MMVLDASCGFSCNRIAWWSLPNFPIYHGKICLHGRGVVTKSRIPFCSGRVCCYRNSKWSEAIPSDGIHTSLQVSCKRDFIAELPRALLIRYYSREYGQRGKKVVLSFNWPTIHISDWCWELFKNYSVINDICLKPIR